MTLYALGPEGTFSHELACKLVPPEEVQLLPAIGMVLAAVEKGLGEGVIPVENSEAGGVGPSLDGLLRYNVFVTAEIYIEVHHFLASFLPIGEVTVIYAHPQTSEQCSECLDKLGIEIIPTKSNAASAIELLDNRKCAAAVVSEKISGIYHLPVVMPRIENNSHNITRFFRVSDTPVEESMPEKCSIIVDPATDRPGLLYELLGVFGRRGINLCRIESRPSKRGMGSYVFFIDLTTSPGYEESLSELKGLTDIKQLGCYKRLEVAL
jgi:prephenate dehydratase